VPARAFLIHPSGRYPKTQQLHQQNALLKLTLFGWSKAVLHFASQSHRSWLAIDVHVEGVRKATSSSDKKTSQPQQTEAPMGLQFDSTTIERML